jgi:hypothetical protein
MMIDWVMGRSKVTGNNKLIDAVDPNPGSTPTSVPRNTPRKQYIKFVGSKAILMAIEK